ncbi:hypothetical protein CSC82_19455 [Rhodobacteraceae bacterium 4F10]|nr:hypothetical protein CSC82_19455 [Rhodobacteraceae bacterium 4F10]
MWHRQHYRIVTDLAEIVTSRQKLEKINEILQLFLIAGISAPFLHAPCWWVSVRHLLTGKGVWGKWVPLKIDYRYFFCCVRVACICLE